MARFSSLVTAALILAAPLSAQNAGVTGRIPSVPLVTHDPYFSVWSPADKWTDAGTVHWTGASQPLTGLIRIDNKAFRFLGATPVDTPALPQTRTEITPTRTIGTFEGEGVRLTVTFTSPLLPDDVAVMSRPLTYITFEPQSLDGKAHSTQIAFFTAPQIAVNTPDQEVRAEDATVAKLDAARVGTTSQPVLQKKGDNLRIDWGYAYLAAPGMAKSGHWARDAVKKMVTAGVSVGQAVEIAAPGAALAFAENGALPLGDNAPHLAAEGPSLAALCNFGEVSKPISQHILFAYDDLYSIQLMGRKLRPFWRRQGMDASGLLQAAERDYPTLQKRCAAFDNELLRDSRAVGGESYARLIAQSYRVAIAAHKIAADERGRALVFAKENFSNGCISTVDVIYPAAPIFLQLSPELLKGNLTPVLDYAASPRWKFPFAPHDLGTYPKANGQVYGGGERTEENQMPVEESGNMLILLAALAKIEGNAKYSEPYFPVLSKWASYLKEKGLDPESQLSTDDFAGHLAHNTNLSLKAIVALGGYAQLCEMSGRRDEAKIYRDLTQDMAKKWAPMADAGDHFRLAFDKPGTWSQKYNLVWDKLLGLNLFPAEIARKELAFYGTKLNPYGLPLDNRKTYTKLDWTVWTATLANDKATFEKLIAPLEKFWSDSPNRVPLSDWYETTNARQVGFQARPVIGGVFIKALDDMQLWRKWAMRGGTVKELPPGEIITEERQTLVSTAQDEKNIRWRYTMDKPADGWEKPAFAAATDWKEGAGGFGSNGTPGSIIGTEWTTPDIWLRRSFTLPANTTAALQNARLWIYHDEDAEVFINGVLAVKVAGFTPDYEDLAISAEARAALKPGENLMAIHCHQTGGGQYVDAGFVSVVEKRGK